VATASYLTWVIFWKCFRDHLSKHAVCQMKTAVRHTAATCGRRSQGRCSHAICVERGSVAHRHYAIMCARSTWHSRRSAVDCVESGSAGLHRLSDTSDSVTRSHCSQADVDSSSLDEQFIICWDTINSQLEDLIAVSLLVTILIAMIGYFAPLMLDYTHKISGGHTDGAVHQGPHALGGTPVTNREKLSWKCKPNMH